MHALLRMLLVCIRSYLKAVLRYKFVVLDVYHPYTLHLREQGCEDPWLFFEAKRGLPANKKSLETLACGTSYESETHSVCALLSFALWDVVRYRLTRYGQCHLGGMCTIYCPSVYSTPPPPHTLPDTTALCHSTLTQFPDRWIAISRDSHFRNQLAG
jgi:hypothetical protein